MTKFRKSKRTKYVIKDSLAYISHKEVISEEMKDWRFRFWWYVLWPKHAVIRVWLRLRRFVMPKNNEESKP